MTAWPGGNCPDCGEFVPTKVIHCPNCRCLLNSELQVDSVEIPEFIPLQEISSMAEVKIRGYYLGCPVCQKELRINRKYVGQHVSCNFCSANFPLDLSNRSIGKKAVFARCPHCDKELRADQKYLGHKVTCKHCGGLIEFVGELA